MKTQPTVRNRFYREGLIFLVCLLGFASGRNPAMENPKLSYGAFVTAEGTTFRLLAPRAEQVWLVLFDRPEAASGREYAMQRTAGGVWTLTLPGAGYGTLYGYRLAGPAAFFDPSVIVADPYTLAAVTQNSYRHVAKSLIVDTAYDWEGDTWLRIDPRDLVIYEMHIRDMTAHPSAGARNPGTYSGLVDPDQRGGIAHLLELGVNAVQIMPAMDFANVEVPFRDPSAPVYNTWNPYARNHWGYMTTFFFAPESYYATDGTAVPGAWNGADGRAVREFKDMVKALHRAGIAVIMDVVYNHVSNYDYHPFKYIDRELYFRLDEKGAFVSQSGCGNDTRSEHPAVRQLILESARYWMTEYHVDGFRFDLGNLIDPVTRELVIAELRSTNPVVIVLAEPWGGGYDPEGFSDQGWASFNDRFRNGVKGQNPRDGLGFIFGRWQDANDQRSLRRYVMGSLREFGGQYVDVAHSVNYLESHDDLTLGDFIRLGTRQVGEEEVIADRMVNARVRGRQLALNKLGALFLFTSQGITFLHQGQEWGRSKVIAPTAAPDPRVGRIDHNSYEKDNETNWLNWDEKELNRELVDYYRGLIQLRQTFPEFRHSVPDDFTFLDVGDRVAVAYILQDRFVVLLNGDPENPLAIQLPEGEWTILVDSEGVALSGKGVVSGEFTVPPTSGAVLRKKD
jgi:pullulanase/glycogen debranching enzyme